MTLNPSFEQLARLRTLVAKANGGRRARILDLETVLEVARDALASKLRFAWRHAGAHVDARTSTTLCLAVHSNAGVTVGLAGTSALDPDPGKGWSELRPWNERLPAHNVPKCEAWGERVRDDRLVLTVDAERPRRPTSDGGALLDAVLQRPDDDAPRLVYADWLTEQGDPRGELIAIQCARAAGDDSPELERREWTLLSAHTDAWRTALDPQLFSVKLRRGFIDEVFLSAEVFAEHGEALLAREPIRSVNVVNANDEGATQVAASRALRRISGLRFSTINRGPRIGIGGLYALLASHHLGTLKSLILEAQDVGDEASGAFENLGIAALPKLEALTLAGDELGSASAIAFARTPWIRHLKKVALTACALSNGDVARLVHGAGAFSWEELDLDKNGLGDAAARAIATHDRLVHLKRLSLAHNQIGHAGAQALLDSTRLKTLTALNLGSNRIGGLLSEKVRQRFGRW